MSDVPKELQSAAPARGSVLDPVIYAFQQLTHMVAATIAAGKQEVGFQFLKYGQYYFIFGEALPLVNPIEYRPVRPPSAYPELAGFREERVPGRGSRTLAVWRKKGTDEGKPVYVMFHGRRGHWGDVGFDHKKDIGKEYDRHYRAKWLKAAADTGAEVIAVHMSGQGASRTYGGWSGEENFKKDVAALADYLEAQHIPPERVVLVGESMGGAVAIMLACEMTKRGHAPEGIALVNSFTSMRDCVALHRPELPPGRLAKALKHPLDSKKRISEELDPDRTFLHLVHVLSDSSVPFTQRAELHRAAADRHMHVTLQDLGDDALHPNIESEHTSWNPRIVMQGIEEAWSKRPHRPRLPQPRGQERPGAGMSL